MRALLIVALIVLAATVAGASGVNDGVSSEDAPEEAFAIGGSPDFLYGRGTELRWSLDQDVLAFQTTRDQRYRVEVLTPNVIRLCSVNTKARCSLPKYLIRVGSPEYERMAAFRQCVEDNRGEPLFEVKECPLPFPLEPA